MIQSLKPGPVFSLPLAQCFALPGTWYYVTEIITVPIATFPLPARLVSNV